MKKLSLSLIVLIGMIAPGNCQIGYFNAQTLKSNLNGNIWNDDESIKIFKFYLGTPPVGQNPEDYYVAAFEANPFLGKDYNLSFDEVQSSKIIGSISDIVSSVPGLNVTNFADGLSQFLVARVKEELSISFFAEFRDKLAEYWELQTLFPNTYSVLNSIDQEIYRFSAYTGTLRESFNLDLSLMLPHYRELLEDDRIKAQFTDNLKLYNMLLHAAFIAQEFADGAHPGDVLHNFATEQATPENLIYIDKNAYNYLRLVDIFSQSLRSETENKYWVPADSINMLRNDTTVFKIYLGLIWQQAKNSGITIKGDITPYIGLITGFSHNTTDIERNFTNLKIKMDSDTLKPGFEDYYKLFYSGLNLIKFIDKTADVTSEGKIKTAGLKDFITITDNSANLVFNVYQENYAMAVMNLTGIYNAAFVKPLDKKIEELKIANAGKEEIKTQQQLFDTKNRMMNAIVKYGSFGASLVEAENSEQVQQAIEAIALPPGSSRIKKETRSSVSLNAFVGPYFAYENLPVENSTNYEYGAGISSPVGIAFNKSVDWCNTAKNNSSISLMFSVIDLGAVTSLRFKDDKTETLPLIKLSDIFSPGVFLVYGFPKLPVALSAFAQMGPRLHKITDTEAEVSDVYYRYGISLMVDIPIINLGSKAK
ncbi:MAG: hypothetical protein JXJ22_18560 [Bacteroidales bacterium]|nr:hypothetical protein [Bacteroidales bacterium]